MYLYIQKIGSSVHIIVIRWSPLLGLCLLSLGTVSNHLVWPARPLSPLQIIILMSFIVPLDNKTHHNE